MDKPEQIISDEAIDSVWQGANFGPHFTEREVIRNTLLKFACGWASGKTAHRIVAALGLACINKPTLTKRGKEYLWACYSDGNQGEIDRLTGENDTMRRALENQVLSKDIAKKVLLAAAALVNEDRDEAYHHLYLIADPTMKYLVDPWQDLEAIAGETVNELAKAMMENKALKTTQ